MREYQSQSQYEVELQIPHCVYTEEKKESNIGRLRKHLGQLFHELAKQKGCEIVEGHLMSDHVILYRLWDWMKMLLEHI